MNSLLGHLEEGESATGVSVGDGEGGGCEAALAVIYVCLRFFVITSDSTTALWAVVGGIIAFLLPQSRDFEKDRKITILNCLCDGLPL